MPLPPDLEEIKRAVTLFLDGSDGIVELRVPKTQYDGVISGYFSDPVALAKAAAAVSGKAPGVYVTLNPVPADLLARADNRIKSKAQALTIDREILRRVWLLLDFDPIRSAGISSTEAEHDTAIAVARQASEGLANDGWPAPVLGDSGNGAHLLYRIDLPNDADSAALVKAVLAAAAQRYGTPEIDVDLTVFNASRISKLYGTPAQKGDSTPARPHRLSRILSRPDVIQTVPIALLQLLAAELKPEKPAQPTQRLSGPASVPREFHLEQWLVERGVPIHRGPDVHDGSERWVLKACPFNPEHKHPDAALFRRPGGALAFVCLHNSCADKNWAKFREFYEPDRKQWVARPVHQRSSGSPQPFAPIPGESDIRDEIPVSPADVEAAVDAAITADDLVEVMKLSAEISTLRPMVRAVVVAKLREHFKRRLSMRDLEKAMKDAIAAMEETARPDAQDDEEPETSADEPNLLCYPLTDAGNGERIVALFGADIRYCVEMKRWLVWDGARWAVDELNVMRQKAKMTARRLYAQAKGEAPFGGWARASESYAAVSAALGSAATDSGIPIMVSELDQHPYLLNCPNGVVDLRDGKLLPHNREFLITKLCPVPYNPKAICPRFVGFLEWAMGANPEADISERTARLVGFIQRAFGYSLTSDVSEKAVFILHGERGNNGKTTLLTLFRDLLGRDYSGQLVIDTVMSMKNQDATTRADLADLRGVRLVVTSEVEKEHKLNEGKIKYITAGMGSIKSCRKYENPIEFTATHKLFMDCNHRPVVRGVDDAIWRRLKLIPFDVTVSEADKDLDLPNKLRAEMAGILAWAVRGCVDWKRNGLGDPPEVASAGEEWREHDDPLKEFLDDYCLLDEEELYIKASELGQAYEYWAKQNRERYPLGREAFNERLQAKGLKQSRSRRIDGKQARAWEGINIRPEILAGLRRAGVFPTLTYSSSEE
ncbi:MAG: hypothetical protein JWN34_35 [Bryobacterales bacterium]|nr:hypothetical protein [Bryobacterales bacterium]